MTKYKIVEVFKSIQGEGKFMGYPATFIRFFGCNLTCSFCDEPKHKRPDLIKEMTAAEIMDACLGTELVVITGGEPSMQNLYDLISLLSMSGHIVSVESNGYNYDNISRADHKVLAPKITRFPRGQWDEVKLLVDTKNSAEIEKEITIWKREGVPVWLQPINYTKAVSGRNLKKTIELCLKHDLPISPQLHKFLGVD